MSGKILRCGIFTKFDDEKVKMQKLLRQIEKVSLIVDTWTTKNHFAILGIMIHWIDDMWNLHECVLAVEELRESRGGANMTKVLHEVHVDYNLTDLVRFFLFFHTFLY